MRSLFLTVCLLFIALLSNGQQPEPIVSFASVLKPPAWYAEQNRLWKAEVNKNPGNAFAWYNYYRSMRNLTRTDTTDKSSQEAKYARNREIVEAMEKAVPESFEYHIVKWMFEGNNLKYIDHLRKAEELGKGRTEHLSDMLGWGEVTRDIAKRDKYALEWLDHGLISPGLLYYNHNVLAGLKPHAILLTIGDNDTYPCWLLQAKGVRRDVLVINASLIHIDSYRDAVFRELGLPLWPSDESIKGKEEKEKAYERYKVELIRYLASNAKQYPVYVSVTCGEKYIQPVADSLYLIGLAYEYSKVVIDNTAQLRRNFETRYTLDYLDHPYYQDPSAYYTRQANSNYVVPMIKLYDHYMASGEESKASALSTRLLALVAGTKEEAQIKEHLNRK